VPWQRLLDGPDALAAAAAIVEACRARTAEGIDEHLARTLLFDAAHDAGLLDDGDLAAAELELAIARAFESSAGPWLFGGLLGVGWVTARVVSADEVIDAVDRAAASVLDVPSWHAHHDLISGLVGIGVYALERVDSPTGLALARRVIDHLEAVSQPQAVGTRWFTAPDVLPPHVRVHHPDGHVDLGLAHGIAGIIGLLARYVDAGVEVDRARALLEAAVAFLWHAVPPRSPARFPAYTSSAEPARLAWCYGDLGIAISMLAAARATDNAGWQADAVALARSTCERPDDQQRVIDAALCHGAAGIGHILNRIFQVTGDPAIAALAHAWFARTLDMRRPGEGIAGFAAPSRTGPITRWVANESLLMGAPGIGLALIACATDREPIWDRILLCDVPSTAASPTRQ
jgi:hypothetical protein